MVGERKLMAVDLFDERGDGQLLPMAVGIQVFGGGAKESLKNLPKWRDP